MKHFGWMVVLILLAGCGPVMVVSSDTLGGVRDGPKWGIVKYLNQGADFVIKERSDAAKKIMERFCNPDNYRVLTFDEKTDIVMAYNTLGTFNYLYVRFECVK